MSKEVDGETHRMACLRTDAVGPAGRKGDLVGRSHPYYVHVPNLRDPA